MTTDIEHISITPKKLGFTVDVTFQSDGDKTARSDEYAFTNFDDMVHWLRLMFSPVPTILSVDLAAPDSEQSVTCIVGADGWREWNGGAFAHDYPPGVKRLSDVMVQRRGDPKRPIDPSNWSRAVAFNWNHLGNDFDIIAYKVLKR